MTAFSDDPMLGHLTEQTDLLVRSARDLDDRNVREPSLLPGWSRAHVLAHVARNADALANVARSAITGVLTPMYPSAAARDAGIEATATSSATALEADVESSAERLLGLLAEVPEHALDLQVPSGRGDTLRVGALPWLRLREVVYHHVDLGMAYTFGTVPPDLLRRGLDEAPRRLRGAGPGVRATCRHADGSSTVVEVGDGAVPVEGTAADVLAWLTGRSTGADLTSPTGAPLPQLPSWG